ncbi:MAG: SEL1-like repeat protein, partial [Hyphomicrobiales bacterium]|nr:SEL1-like repeat protein [Hyphomicrobiales bacterium]
MIRLAHLFFLAFVCVCGAFVAHAQTQPARLALLIGNQGYTDKVGRLQNPHNDVALVEASLKKLGFTVTVLKDGTYKQIDTALKRYVTDVRRAGRGAISFFYFSGHGVANPETQTNYLIPIDVTDADDDKIWFESFQQNVVIDLFSREAPGATHYLVFDACRNELNVGGTAAKSLGADKGFVPIADTSGLLIAYATAPKRTASDVGQGGGPYAKVLAEELLRPGIEAVSMFRNVQIRVKQSINQDPWLSFPSLPPVYLAGRDAAPTGPERQSQMPSGMSEAAITWERVRQTQSRAVLEAFVRQFPNTVYAVEASERLAELQRPAGAAQPPPASNQKADPQRPAATSADVTRWLQEANAAVNQRDDQTAVRLYRLAADQGDASAQAMLGFLHEQGRGGLPKNDREAARLYKLAADQGQPGAQFNLGVFNELGRGGLTKDDREAARLYKLAADQGNMDAQLALGMFYAYSRAGLSDDREAARLFRLASDKGQIGAQSMLAFFYEQGRGGLAKNDIEAARLYKLAADKGQPGAQFNLGVFHAFGRGGLAKDDVEAVRLYRLAADQGNANAQLQLGASYQTGRGGLAKDEAEAARLYGLAANQGNAEAQLALGVLHSNSLGGMSDDREAARLFRAAAEAGNAGGQAMLGYFYEFGRGGLPKDDKEAARLYKLAADQGQAGAQYNLGVFHQTGRGGLAKNDREAARLYKLAADQG